MKLPTALNRLVRYGAIGLIAAIIHTSGYHPELLAAHANPAVMDEP